MKKFLAAAATVVLAFFLTSDLGFAQGKGIASKLQLHQDQAVNFIDADGDGICDNQALGAGQGNQGQVKPNFVDADGDGVCDNEPIGAGRRNKGQVKPNFVDADGDGVCDNNVTGTGMMLRDGSGSKGTSSGRMNGRKGR